MIDTHCHLDFSYFDGILENTLYQAKKAGVNQFIVPAVGELNWQKIDDLTRLDSNIFPAYGIHPWLESYDEVDLGKLSKWLESHPAIAIGECGLDFYSGRSNADLQQRVFSHQISLAKQYHLPLIIHSRKAVDEVRNMLKTQDVRRGVFHGFAGSVQQANNIIEAGFHIGVGGMICNLRAVKIRAVAKSLPLNKILLETDSPDQGVYDMNKNTPKNIVMIAQELARLKNIELEQVVEQCDANARECFEKLNG